MQFLFRTHNKPTFRNLSTNQSDTSFKPPTPQKPIWLLLLILVTFLSGLVWAVLKFDEVVIQKEDGSFELAPKRLKKLEKELAALDNSEQYALVALENGYYPCLTCLTTDTIFLFRGEVWKYGVTKNGEKGRYKGQLPAPNLDYKIEYIGSTHECQRLEKVKIYNYPLLPENLKRIQRLARPPGNLRDL